MDDSALDALIDAGTKALGIEMKPEWLPAVRMHLANLPRSCPPSCWSRNCPTIWTRRRCSAHERPTASTTATEIAAAVASKRRSATEVMAACLDRIERLNPILNAFTAVLGDRARAKAAAIDASEGQNPDRWPASPSR